MQFGDPDPRVMALPGAVCVDLNALGFTNRSLRAQVNHLLGVAYTVNQMSYDLARLRRNGLIERREHTNTYVLTPGRATRRDLLHQGQRPVAPASARRRPPTSTHRVTKPPWPPSTATSTAALIAHAWRRLPENSRSTSEFEPQRNARTSRCMTSVTVRRA